MSGEERPANGRRRPKGGAFRDDERQPGRLSNHPRDGDPGFAAKRRADDFRCPAADPAGDWDWPDCPHFRARNHSRECARCGIDERRMTHSDERPLLEEHHLSYADTSDGENRNSDGTDDEPSHEITVSLCRWCHAKIHNSWARLGDDASPDPEAIAAREGRRSREQDEFGFSSAADRYDDE
uniref:DUF7097 family protein n=1 Tax=Halococcus salifodinae TaxID=36738 RepID=UPI00373FCE12